MGDLRNLADLLTARAAQAPETVAVREAGSAGLTWAELDRRVTSTAAGLSATGLVAGQRVLLALPNSVRLVTDYLACLRAGLVAVPIDPRTAAEERERLAGRVGARLVLTPDSDHDRGGDAIVVPPADPDSLAVLLRTAATSAEAKIAMINHRSLLLPARGLAGAGLVTADDTVLAALPLWHVYGLGVVVGGWLASGCRLVITGHDAGPELAEIVAESGATVLPVVPALLERLLRAPDLADRLRGVRTILSAAAPLSVDLADRFTEASGHRVESGYGLTEAAGGVTTTLRPDGTGGTGHRIGHVGHPMPGVEVRIGDGSDPGEPDRIRIRSAQLFAGYWPDGGGGPDADGWYDTGDLGYLADGELYLVERSRELIMVDGFGVYPAEVERIIAELDGVLETAVIGDPAGMIAFVVGPDLDRDRIAEHCAALLPKFKRPASIRLVDGLPRGVTGKVQKSVLRRMTDQDREGR
ncbi:class I adenylate-forming enzyme family protein [Microlunatus parietis]|uniref:Long-chain acyl-CoA synthetase n=1 Tax=Microlunatus parietis TaxID=682979 RepID=A0A7Y9IAS1_9ACTN|nr:class I adenylate-forming enzyme family protein [Microlunatus parietis]NYE73193.1 long-chain acyl-CoA synthetase [Microlunatus parietis]